MPSHVSQVVMHQLRCSGILEVVRMKQQGYPIRMPFEKFYEEYEILGHMQGWAPAADCSEEEAKVSFESVLSCLVLSCLVLSCLVLSCLVLSCLALCRHQCARFFREPCLSSE